MSAIFQPFFGSTKYPPAFTSIIMNNTFQISNTDDFGKFFFSMTIIVMVILNVHVF